MGVTAGDLLCTPSPGGGSIHSVRTNWAPRQGPRTAGDGRYDRLARYVPGSPSVPWTIGLASKENAMRKLLTTGVLILASLASVAGRAGEPAPASALSAGSRGPIVLRQ